MLPGVNIFHLDADRQPNQVRRDARVRLLLRGQLGVRRAGRMNDERLGVRHVGEQREQLQAVDRPLRRLESALQAEGEDRTGPFREILLRQGIITIALQRRVVDPGDVGMAVQKGRDPLRVGQMLLDPQGQRLQPLKQQEDVERTDRGAGVPQPLHARFRDIGQFAELLVKPDSVVAFVGLGEAGELAVAPIEPPAVHDQAADGGAVPADVLRRGMDDDVRPMLDRPDQVRRSERVVDDEGNAALVGDCRHRFDIDQVDARVADGLDEDRFRPVRDGRPKVPGIVRIDELRPDADLRQGNVEQVERSAVQRPGRHDLVARSGDIEDRVGDRRRSGSYRQRAGPSFQRGDALLQHVVRRIADPGIHVPDFFECGQPLALLHALEHEGGRQVDRNGPRPGRRVRLLPGVNLQRIEFPCFLSVVAHRLAPFAP